MMHAYMRAMAAAALVCGTTGCAALDRLTASMIEAGILAPTAAGATAAAGLPGGGVVEVRAGDGRGVGVVVEGGLVLTAAHVVAGVVHPALWRHSEIPGGLAERVEATIVWQDTVNDLCLLRPADAGEPGTSGSAAAGVAWLVTMEASGASELGTVSRRPWARRAEILEGGRFRVSGGVRPGDSGSPLVQAGRVVGVVRTAERYADAAPVLAAAAWADGTRPPVVATARPLRPPGA